MKVAHCWLCVCLWCHSHQVNDNNNNNSNNNATNNKASAREADEENRFAHESLCMCSSLCSLSLSLSLLQLDSHAFETCFRYWSCFYTQCHASDVKRLNHCAAATHWFKQPVTPNLTHERAQSFNFCLALIELFHFAPSDYSHNNNNNRIPQHLKVC